MHGSPNRSKTDAGTPGEKATPDVATADPAAVGLPLGVPISKRRPNSRPAPSNGGRTDMAQIKRHASARWQGSGKDGTGSLTTQSATLKDTPYGFNSRFGDGRGTNPEELIAAAHAGCFSMASAFQLSGAGHPPDSLDCDANLTMEQVPGGWKIAAIHLVLTAKVPGLDNEKFQELVKGAKENCPVSKVLNAEITLEASLV
jgi:osmotically inducible protein OsmC